MTNTDWIAAIVLVASYGLAFLIALARRPTPASEPVRDGCEGGYGRLP